MFRALHVVSLVVAILLALGAVESADGGEKVYWRKNQPSDSQKPPNNGWTPGGKIQYDLRKNKYVYIAVLNSKSDDPGDAKTVTLKIKGKWSSKLELRSTKGFYPESGRLKPIMGDAKLAKKQEDGARIYDLTYSRQVEWEYLVIQNTGKDKFKLDWDVSASGSCGDAKKLGPDEETHWDGSFSSPESVLDDMHITEMEIFPVEGTVNPDVDPWFSGPGGPWSWEFRDEDPDGNPRPLGGVMFYTGGAGLEPGDHYEFTFQMMEQADLEYDYYAFDIDFPEHQLYALDVSPKIREWRTMHDHGGPGSLDILIDTVAVGNAWEGPAAESRSGGIQIIEADFMSPVVLLDPEAVTVTDGVDDYIPDSVELTDDDSILRITFAPGALPDETCYTIDISGAIEDLQSDAGCMIRALVGDVDFNGVVDEDDVDAVNDNWGNADVTNAQFDVNLDGVINLDDMLFVLSLVENRVVCTGCSYNPYWYDGLDDYDSGSNVKSQGGWFTWDMDPYAGALVTDAQAYTEPHSVEVVDASSVTREFCDAEVTQWLFSARLYVPADFVSGVNDDLVGSYLNLFSYYDWADSSSDSEQSVRLHADSVSNTFIRDGAVPAALPLIRDTWVEVEVWIDLEADAYRVFYDGQELGQEEPWSDGVYGGADGFINIAAANFQANDSSAVYWDEIGLFAHNPCPCDLDDSGHVDIDDLFIVLSNWGDCEDPGDCPADLTEDGLVDIDDLFAVLAQWGPCP